jgi:hypothetical protein
VIIENQISPIANRMKTIQGMLAQYFIIKDENIIIDFVSSSNKLKQFTNVSITKPENILENTMKPAENSTKKPVENNVEKNIKNPDYKKHKIDGVSYCSRILSKNDSFEQWRTSLDTKKKDDLADCFLQGLWYLKQKNIILYAEDLKIKIV